MGIGDFFTPPFLKKQERNMPSLVNAPLGSIAPASALDEYSRRINSASIYQSSLLGPGGYSAAQAEPSYAITNPRHRKNMIAMRMHIREGDMLPFEGLETHDTDEKVFVFVVQNKQWVVLEDDLGLFPSDTLITQLRVLAK